MLVCFDGDGIHGNHTRKCETCQVSDSTIYCLTHSSYLCTSCDEHIHAANSIASRHERLWICTICENAPATCVDALSLCTNCDAQIHSLNLLACHHQPIPTTPVSTFFSGSSASNRYHPTFQEAHEDETDSWLFLDPDKNKNQDYNHFSHTRMSDEYLDLLEHTSFTEYQHNDNQPYSFHRGNNGGDTVVHVQNMEANKHENSKATLNCTISSNQNITAFFVDNGIVPEATMSDISKPYATPQKERIDRFSSITPVNTLQFTRMDREEKVIRYREKKKARKFEKKIRYASRKASAEIRPRVRGRFARRIDIEVE